MPTSVAHHRQGTPGWPCVRRAQEKLGKTGHLSSSRVARHGGGTARLLYRGLLAGQDEAGRPTNGIVQQTLATHSTLMSVTSSPIMTEPCKIFLKKNQSLKAKNTSLGS